MARSSIAIAPPGRPTGDDVALDLGQIIAALWGARLRILAFTVFAAIAVFVGLSFATPRYKADAKILIESRDVAPTGTPARGQEVERALLDQEGIASQVQLLGSRDLAREVIGKLELTARPEYGGGGGLVRSILSAVGLGSKKAVPVDERALEKFNEDVTIYQQEKSRVIVVEATATNADLAASIANALAEEYLQVQAGTKQSEARDQLRWLDSEINSLRTRVADADAKVERFRTGAGLLLGPGNATLTTQQLGDLNTQLTAARSQRSDAEAKAKQLRALLDRGADLDGATELLSSPGFQRLKDRRAAIQGRIAELSATLLPGHPQLRSLSSQVSDIDLQLRAEARKILAATENDVKVADARVRDLTARLSDMKTEVSKANEEEIQLRALEREAKTQRDLLETLLARYRETSARQNADALPADARIISRAAPPIQASFPKTTSSTIVAALAAFLLASTVVVLRELLSGRALTGRGTIAMAPALPQPPPPAVLREPSFPTGEPRLDDDDDGESDDGAPRPRAAETSPLAAFVGPPGQFVAAMADASRAIRRVVVTHVAESSAAAALTLARTLAREQVRVILVELMPGADGGRRPSREPLPGMAELIKGDATFGDVIARDDMVPRLHRVAAGKPDDAREMSDWDERLGALVEAFASAYDIVLVGVGLLADAGQVAGIVLGADVVVIAGFPADEAAALRARDALAEAGVTSPAVVTVPAEARPRLATVASAPAATPPSEPRLANL